MSTSTADVPGAVTRRIRDPWLDNVKVVAITLVVVGHGIGLVRNQTELAPALSNFIYLFHIPLFAAVSGWTAQRMEASGEGFMRICLQLLVPYLIFDAIAAMIPVLLDDAGFQPTFDSPSFGLWYLLSLASWRIIWPWLKELDRTRTWFGAVAVAVAVGHLSGVGHTLSVSRSAVFFPAFLTGAMFGADLVPILKRPVVRLVSTVLLAAALAFSWFSRDWLDRTWILGRDAYEPSVNALTAGLLRTAAIVGGIVLALAAASLVTSRRTMLTQLGAFTMYAYLLHIPIRLVIVELGLVPSNSGIVGLVATVIASSVLTIALMTAPVRAVTWPLVDPGRYGRPKR